MKIAGEDAAYYSRVFDRALKEGDRYISLNTGKDDQPFPEETMRFFKSKSEALEYGYTKRTRENEYLESLPILSVQEQLVRRMELQQLTGTPGQAPKDIVIDTGLIRRDERARQEIFTEEISRQLRDQGIKPDQKSLQEHIGQDSVQFAVNGSRREQGEEKSYTIKIEQNESRAFLISAIEAQQNILPQKNQGVCMMRY